MLSRFTSLFQTKSTSSINNDGDNDNSLEMIDSVISEIKNLGKGLSIENESERERCIERILYLMKKYDSTLNIQRVSCHALSNLGMNLQIAKLIISKNGFELIKRSLIRYINDYKLCWLGSSAIWNLARPPTNRIIIGKKGVNLMLKILQIHINKEKVINTAIGALSNLSLNDELKNIISKEKNIAIILNVLNKYNLTHSYSLSVSTSGAGLVANLAVNDDYALTLVSKNTIKLLLNILKFGINNKNNENNNTLYRNTCAALNNMVTANNFLDSFLENKGIEIIYQFLDKTNNNDNTNQYKNLLQNCLINIDIDIENSNNKTTTYHLCVINNKLDILKKLFINDPFININKTDYNNMTILDCAIKSNNINIIKFLTKLGANQYQIHDINNNIKLSINNGYKILKDTRNIYYNIIKKSLTNFPNDLCKELINYQNNIDLLKAINQF